MTDSPPFSQIIDEAMEKKMISTEKPAGHGTGTPETEQRAALQSETRGDNLVDRLRVRANHYEWKKWEKGTANLMREAARTIEQVRASNEELLAACKQAEGLLRNGGVVPIMGMTWHMLCAAIANAERRS